MKTTRSILQEADNTLFTARLGLNLLQGTKPQERIAGLRNLVVFGRAVTNVLQNLRSNEGEKFDIWYNPKVEEMSKDELNTTELRDKILKGLDLAVERLIRKKQKEDGELVFSQNGQIVVVKARELDINRNSHLH